MDLFHKLNAFWRHAWYFLRELDFPRCFLVHFLDSRERHKIRVGASLLRLQAFFF